MLREPFLKHAGSSALPLIHEETVDSFKKLGRALWHFREKSFSLSHAVSGRERIGGSLRIRTDLYRESVVNEIRQSRSPIRVRGYFQSIGYLDFVPQGPSCRRIDVPMDRNYIKNEMGSQSWSSVHFRLGDFRLSKSFLGLDYYEKAIEYLLEHGSPKRFVLFSDEPKFAMKLVTSTKAARWITVAPAPDRLSALQALRLMSEAKSSIVANSTLSWWGAATNPEANIVVAPRLWGVSMTEPPELLPSHWKILDNH